MAKPIVLVAIVSVVVGLLLWAGQKDDGPLVVSGFVEADEIRIGSRVGGRVKAVHVEEGQRVETGQRLVELEPFDLLERRAQAKAQLAERQAELDRLQAGFRPEETAQAKARRDQLAAEAAKLVAGPRKQEIAAARQRVRLAQAEQQLARIDHERTQTLLKKKATTQQAMDEATTRLAAAAATLAIREQELSELEEGARAEDIAAAKAQLAEADEAWRLRRNGYRIEEIAQAKAAVEAAGAALAAIDRQVGELTVVAPVAGTVEAIELRPGDLVGANTPALSLLDTSRLWVRAYVPENRLAIQVGRQVAVRVDSFARRRFGAHVSFVAREAEFTPGNVQTPEERSKQVFRIKAQLDEGLDVLRAGMAADVVFDAEGDEP